MVTPSFTVALSSGVISLSQLYSTSRCWTMPFNSWGERTPRDAKDQATAQVLVRGGFGMQFMGLTMEDTGSFTAPP